MNSPLRIRQLDARLANQIAAGEVVERPASVVKELLENAIDAQARRIEIDIERGGARLIRISDDGQGIHPDDLPLALSRHATSKIHSVEHLAAIVSLGFRGEALASISSVSRLRLLTRQADSDQGWQAEAEGRDMTVTVTPAATPVGTVLEVRDLFYNTPARRKFLRTERTEFAHIEDVVKRQALAQPKVTFVLKHNGKVVRRIPAAQNDGQLLRRLHSLCGKGFVDNCVPVQLEHAGISVQGWLARPQYHRSESDTQFVFVNGRPVKDRMLNHALRQVYQDLLPEGRVAAFVVSLQLDPAFVDVNVHPTKHEVRFSDTRLVHDLLVSSLRRTLLDAAEAHTSVKAASFSVPKSHSPQPQTPQPAPLHATPEANPSAEQLKQQEGVVPVGASHGASLTAPESSSAFEQTESNYQAPSPHGAGGHLYARPSSSRFSRSSSSGRVQEQLAAYQSWSQGVSDLSHDSSAGPVDGVPAVGRMALLPLHSAAAAEQFWLVDRLQLAIEKLSGSWALQRQRGAVASKTLLIPQTLELPLDILEQADWFDAMKAAGFDVRAGKETARLMALPSVLLTHLERDPLIRIFVDFWSNSNTALLHASSHSSQAQSWPEQLLRCLTSKDIRLPSDAECLQWLAECPATKSGRRLSLRDCLSWLQSADVSEAASSEDEAEAANAESIGG